MSDGFASLDAHAYVDNSLSPAERDAFDAALRRDPKLRARVEAWEAQNEAIRLAFGGAPRPRPAPPLGRPSNENNAAPKLAPARPPEPQRLLRGRETAPLRAAVRVRSSPWRLAALGGLAFVVGVLGFAGGPRDPRADLMRRVDSALRASSAFADSKLDFVSDDPRAVSAWLGGRFARLDPNRLVPRGWSLLGVRIVPGVEAAAALVLYEDAIGGRAALMLEPTDALPPLPPASVRDGGESLIAGAEPGFAYAAAGPSHSGIGALIPAKSGE